MRATGVHYLFYKQLEQWSRGALITIQPSSREPLVEQFIRGIREQIGDGTLVPGERLPPARVLASGLDIIEVERTSGR